MVTIEDIKTALIQNNSLTSEIKENLFELVVIFHERFPEITLDQLQTKLRTLRILKSSKFLNRDVSMYDYHHNIIYLNTTEMGKGYDMKHILMFELLNVISSNEYQTGFNIDNKFEALNLGYTEILANYLVGNKSEKMVFPQEASLTNLISIMVGNDTLFNAYFQNNVDTLLNKIKEMGIEV